MSKEKVSFEKAVARLSEIVKVLEQGDAPLEQSLALFEEATGLVRLCGGMLDKAEQKVNTLMRDGDTQTSAQEMQDGE